MTKRLTTLLAMLAALVVSVLAMAMCVLVAPPPAKAAFPGENGRIVFHRQDSDGFVQTWVANRDLSNQHKLTSGPSNSGWAVWKPGGAKLAFDSDRANPDNPGGRSRKPSEGPAHPSCRRPRGAGFLASPKR